MKSRNLGWWFVFLGFVVWKSPGGIRNPGSTRLTSFNADVLLLDRSSHAGKTPEWEPTEETSLVDYILVSWCHWSYLSQMIGVL